MNEAASDSESSDSETCPKLSQGKVRQKSSHLSKSLLEKQSATLVTNGHLLRPLSTSEAAKGIFSVIIS